MSSHSGDTKKNESNISATGGAIEGENTNKNARSQQNGKDKLPGPPTGEGETTGSRPSKHSLSTGSQLADDLNEMENREHQKKGPLTTSQRKSSMRSSRSSTPRGNDSHLEKNYYGIDIGCGFIVLSICDKNNISTVLENELSKRKTYTGICFRDKSRFVGSAVEKMQIRDCENTVTSFKPYFGKNWDEIKEKLKDKKGKLPKNTEDLLNAIGYTIKYYKKDRYYIVDQFYLTLLSKLRDTIEYNVSHLTYFNQFTAQQNEEKNIVLSVPSYYTNKQTVLLNQFCNMLKMNCDGIIPDYLATAITFGYSNRSRFDGERCYLFVDIGYSCCNCTIVKYHNDSIKEEYGLEVMNHNHIQDLNGELIDEKITEYLLDVIKDKHKEDVKKIENSLKLYTKLVKGAIDGKEKLTPVGATSTMINVDGLLDDGEEDFQHEFKIDDLNKLLLEKDGFVSKFNAVIAKTMKEAGEIDEKKMQIVIAGGTTRIPLFQHELIKVLKKNNAEIQTLNLTLNMDECVSTGCSYYDAIINNRISYNINDKYSRIVIDGDNIKNKKNMTKILAKIKNFIFFKLDEVLKEKIIKNDLLLYYINCYKYYIQFYIILHQDDLKCLDSFKYIYDELKEVRNLLKSELNGEYKCSCFKHTRSETYKSIFTSVFEDVNISKIDDLTNLLASGDKTKVEKMLKELKGEGNDLGQKLIQKIKETFPSIDEKSLEILNKVQQRESYSIIISLLLDLLSFPSEQIEDVKRCLNILNELIDHVNDYTVKIDDGNDLLVKYCDDLWYNEEEILTNEKNNKEISSLKNEMETKIYAYKDKISKYSLTEFNDLSNDLSGILNDIKAKKNVDQPLEYFKKKEKEMVEKCKALEKVIDKIQIEIHIDSTLKDREPVARAYHLNELNEYKRNYERFSKWVEDFNMNINKDDLNEVTTKVDFDDFIKSLDEAVDCIKEMNSLCERNDFRLKYLSKTIEIINAIYQLYYTKKWLNDYKQKERKLSDYKSRLDKLKEAIKAVPKRELVIGDRVIDRDGNIGIITKIHDNKQHYDIVIQNDVMIVEIDDVYPYDSNYVIKSNSIGIEVEFIPKGGFEKTTGIIHSKNPDGTYNIYKMNKLKDANYIDYYEEDVNLENNIMQGEGLFFKTGDNIKYYDGGKWTDGIFEYYVDNTNNEQCYIGYTNLENYSKEYFLKEDGSDIHINDVVYVYDKHNQKTYFRIIREVDKKNYEVRRIHYNAYSINNIKRIYSPNEIVFVDVKNNGKWEKGKIEKYIGEWKYSVYLFSTGKPITLENEQIKPFVEDKNKPFENGVKVIYNTKSLIWEKGTIKGNDGKTYTIINENTKKEEKEINPLNIRLYDNVYNPFYYKNDDVLFTNEKGEVERRILNEEYVRGNNYSLYLDNNQYNIHDKIEYMSYAGEIIKINHNHTFNIIYEGNISDKKCLCYSEMVDKSLIKPDLTTPTIKTNKGENVIYQHNYQLGEPVMVKSKELGWIEGKINRIHNYLYDIFSSNSKMLLKDRKYTEIYPCYYIDSVYRVGDIVLHKEVEYRIIQIVNDNTVKLMKNDDKKIMVDVDINDIELKDGLEYEENEEIQYYHSEYRNVFDGDIIKKLENNKYVIKCSNTETYKNVKPEYMEKKKTKSKFKTNDIIIINKNSADEGIIIRKLKDKKYLIYHQNDYEIVEENEIEKANKK